jgi:hypothetical protein
MKYLNKNHYLNKSLTITALLHLAKDLEFLLYSKYKLH